MGKNIQKILKLPIGVQLFVFSFMDFQLLLDKVSHLSKQIREILPESEILNQERVLAFKFDQEEKVLSLDSFEYGIALATQFKLSISDFSTSHGFLLQHMLKDKNKKKFEKFYQVIDLSKKDQDQFLKHFNACQRKQIKKLEIKVEARDLSHLNQYYGGNKFEGMN